MGFSKVQSLSYLVGGDRCSLCSQRWGTSVSFTLQRQLHGFSSLIDILINIGFLFHNLYFQLMHLQWEEMFSLTSGCWIILTDQPHQHIKQVSR
jgi:hypothetical protein